MPKKTAAVSGVGRQHHGHAVAALDAVLLQHGRGLVGHVLQLAPDKLAARAVEALPDHRRLLARMLVADVVGDVVSGRDVPAVRAAHLGVSLVVAHGSSEGDAEEPTPSRPVPSIARAPGGRTKRRRRRRDCHRCHATNASAIAPTTADQQTAVAKRPLTTENTPNSVRNAVAQVPAVHWTIPAIPCFEDDNGGRAALVDPSEVARPPASGGICARGREAVGVPADVHAHRRHHAIYRSAATTSTGATEPCVPVCRPTRWITRGYCGARLRRFDARP